METEFLKQKLRRLRWISTGEISLGIFSIITVVWRILCYGSKVDFLFALSLTFELIAMAILICTGILGLYAIRRSSSGPSPCYTIPSPYRVPLGSYTEYHRINAVQHTGFLHRGLGGRHVLPRRNKCGIRAFLDTWYVPHLPCSCDYGGFGLCCKDQRALLFDCLGENNNPYCEQPNAKC